ncbi:MAG: hypothetical protein SFV20_02665 [Sphingopyxis sp.]|nr:hypothetical protein [Sphingopyxis sp.]
MKNLSCAALALLALAPSFALANDAALDRDPPEKAPSAMTNKEIAAYNEGLNASHPYYIKCRKIEETGSLVKKARVCRTNEEWKKAFAVGNQNSRDTIDAMTNKSLTSN